MPTYDPRMDMQTLDKNLWETSGARFNAAERLALAGAGLAGAVTPLWWVAMAG